MTLDFFKDVCSYLNESISSFNDKHAKHKVLIEKLIFKESKIYLNIDDSDIIKLLEDDGLNPNSEYYDTQVFIKLIAQNGFKIKSCKANLPYIYNLKYDYFDSIEEMPNFIFTKHLDENLCNEIRNTFGIICIRDIKQLNENILENQLITIDLGSPFNEYKKKLSFLPKSNSLVLIDNYILTNDEKYIFLRNLLKFLIDSDKLKVIVHLTIILDLKNQKINLQNIEDLIKKDFNRGIQINIINQNVSHARWIFTNSFALTSEWGFKERYNKLTHWVYCPIYVANSHFKEILKPLVKNRVNEINQNRLAINN